MRSLAGIFGTNAPIVPFLLPRSLVDKSWISLLMLRSSGYRPELLRSCFIRQVHGCMVWPPASLIGQRMPSKEIRAEPAGWSIWPDSPYPSTAG